VKLYINKKAKNLYPLILTIKCNGLLKFKDIMGSSSSHFGVAVKLDYIIFLIYFTFLKKIFKKMNFQKKNPSR
jgi:hypothetical protein